MSPACGSLVTGIDIGAGLSNQAFDEIHAAFLERTVLIFRDQQLDEDQHVAFARRFGALQTTEISAFGKERATSRNRRAGIRWRKSTRRNSRSVAH